MICFIRGQLLSHASNSATQEEHIDEIKIRVSEQEAGPCGWITYDAKVQSQRLPGAVFQAGACRIVAIKRT